MSEAKLLRALADKIESLEAVQEFSSDITDPGSLTVSWTNGHDTPGYEVLSTAIGELVKQHWTALRSQVLKHRETDVQTARNEWTSHGSKKPAAPVAEASTTPTPAVADVSARRAA